MNDTKTFDFVIAGGRVALAGRGAPMGIAPSGTMHAAGKRQSIVGGVA